MSADAQPAVFVDIKYLEYASNWRELQESSRGHLCHDWDEAERFALEYELERDVVVTAITMTPRPEIEQDQSGRWRKRRDAA